MVEGVTGVISQPLKGEYFHPLVHDSQCQKCVCNCIGAKKEGLWGLVKGTGRGMLGLVLRPTGGIIDLTSATFNAVQRCALLPM